MSNDKKKKIVPFEKKWKPGKGGREVNRLCESCVNLTPSLRRSQARGVSRGLAKSNANPFWRKAVSS